MPATSRRRIAPAGWALLAGLAALLALWAKALPGETTRGEPRGPAATQPHHNPTSAPATFKVATYNILHLNRDLKEIAATIRKSQADLVCLQETNARSEQYLRKHLKDVYPHARFRRGSQAGGFGFLSKAPLQKVKYLPRKFGHFGTYLCQVTLGGRAVQVANVHLVATNPPRKADLAGLWDLQQKTESVRAKEIAYVHGKLPRKVPVILAGDLNSSPGWEAPRFLKNKGFIDSLASARADHASVVTWKWARGDRAALRLDYLFHTKEIRTVSSKVLTSEASDHSLVVSEMTWLSDPASRPTTRPGAETKDAAPETRPGEDG